MAKNHKPIRVVTINTWKGDGAYTGRLAVLANQLRLLGPDVVCLQEALRSSDGQLDTARHLARSLNLQLVYAFARQKIRAVESERIDCHSRLAVLTSLPIIFGLVREEADAFPSDKSRSVLNHPDGEGCFPSDHFGVMAEITPGIRG